MRTGLLIITILFFAGCKNKNAVPGNILPQSKMQAVIWDMMRADQFLTDYVLNKDTMRIAPRSASLRGDGGPAG